MFPSATIILAASLAVNHPAGTPRTDRDDPVRRGPLIVAHRGASADAPENTLAAFQLGFEQGADAIEGDFRLTRDGRVVAVHDRDLARTTGDPRRVDEVTLEEMRSLDAGSWGSWKDRGFEGASIPTLAEVLAIVPEGKGILIEIKDSPRIVERLVAVLEASGIGTDQVAVISFDPEVVASLKRSSPRWKALWLTSFRSEDGAWTPSVEEIVSTARRIRADGVDVHAEPAVVDETFAKQIRDAGLELHTWTVNDAALAKRLVAIGVSSITTDRPGALRREMGS